MLTIAQSAEVGKGMLCCLKNFFLYLSLKVKTTLRDLSSLLNCDAFLFPKSLENNKAAVVEILSLLARVDLASENFPDWV